MRHQGFWEDLAEPSHPSARQITRSSFSFFLLSLAYNAIYVTETSIQARPQTPNQPPTPDYNNVPLRTTAATLK
jgi:hypothetical protein